MASAQGLQQAWAARGPLASALWPLSRLFGAIAALRRALYRIGLLRQQRVAAPVVVVGNLIAGGAGKTPVVMAIVASLRARGHTPGIVSRGYGAQPVGVLEVTRETPAANSGDEPLLLHLRTGAPVVIGRDRVAAAKQLLQRHPEVDVVVSDDGLQHLRLARDAQVLVFDERGVGNGWLLPAGPLREPLPRAAPARTLVVYNARAASTPLPGTLARRGLAGVVGLADWWAGRAASIDALLALRGRRVIAAAGIASPERFFTMLREHGLAIEPRPLPDHHPFAELPWPADTADVVVTEKDAIKLDPARIGRTRVWVAPLDFALDAAFDAALFALLPLPGGRSDGNPIA
ncbi:MAG TPA: tetraacyldisaccharide 4'-kinase [Burkholderiaceae bacterium]|jgi:tetraacyldisaccharide 4'-kinase